MQTLTPDLIQNKKVLLRMDLDVPLENGRVVEDFRLEKGLDTLDFCLQYGSSVIIMGHLGRPKGEDPALSVKPVVEWFESRFAHINLQEGKLHILENLRFEAGEDSADPAFAKELADLGEVFINEAFASHHPSASTTVLPTLLPHAAGFQFQKEVETLNRLRTSPKRPYVVIIGGAKVDDKLPAVLALANISDLVLVGGKIAQELKNQDIHLPANVMLGKLNEEGTDISPDTTEAWRVPISQANQILWNGPLGKFEDETNNQSEKIAQMIIARGVDSTIGGGDTIAALNKYNLLGNFTFVSTGGGATLEFLIKGTLPTIEALK